MPETELSRRIRQIEPGLSTAMVTKTLQRDEVRADRNMALSRDSPHLRTLLLYPVRLQDNTGTSAEVCVDGEK